MKKIIKLFVFICICFMPFIADAKIHLEYDGVLREKAFIAKENNKFYYMDARSYDFYFDNIYSYDKDYNLNEKTTFIDDDTDMEALYNSNIGKNFFNAYRDIFGYYFDLDIGFFYVAYYDDKFGDINVNFEDDLEFTTRVLGNKYEVFKRYKDIYEIDDISEFNGYVVLYYTSSYDDYVSIFDSEFNIIFNKKLSYGEIVYVSNGIIFYHKNNGILEMYSLDSTLIDTFTIEEELVKRCLEFYPKNMRVDGKYLYIYYTSNYTCPSRIIMNDESDADNLVKDDEDYYTFTLRYKIHYDVIKVPSDNGDFTYEFKEDENGNQYVELDIKPKEGFSVEEIIVTDINGDKINVTNNKFEMPLTDVTVEVKYIEGEYLPIPDTGLSQSITLIIIGLILIGLGSYTFKYVRE